MKLKYIILSLVCMAILFTVSCDLSGINRNWTGSCVITYANGDVQVQYQGIVESFTFDVGGSCLLFVRDTFLTGSSTIKTYIGTYVYNDRYYSLSYSLMLVEIDDIPVNTNMNYDLDGSDTFNMENDTGILTAAISGQDIPIDASINVVFSLTVE